MVDKFIIQKTVEAFNSSIEAAKNSTDFNNAIEELNKTDRLIEFMKHAINEMRQDRHDTTQDVYNKFKNKGYVKTIKFL